MLFHDVIFAVVLLTLCPSGNGHTQNWVKQWPDHVYSTPGENITMHCQIHTHVQETISRCLVRWHTTDNHGTYPRIDKHSQFSGRHCEDWNKRLWSSSLTLNSLERNDTGMFYCNYFCRINGTIRQHYGTGTKVFVHFENDKENVTHPLQISPITGGEKEESIAYLLLVLIALVAKFVLFTCMGCVTIFSPRYSRLSLSP